MIDLHQPSRPAGVRAGITLLLLLLAPSAFAQYWVPDTPSGVVELENSLRLLVDIDEWDPMLDVTWRFEDEDFRLRYRAVTLGSYYRIHDNVKVGAFYRLQGGARHDDDWVEEGPTDWEWDDTSGRFESVLIGDVSPRVLLDFIPGENWVLMIKNRYLINLYNDHQKYFVRPGLTYFWIADREPVLNVTLAYGVYFGLNFGDSAVYKRAPYLSALYHINRTWKAELGVSRETITWSTSDEADDVPGWDYEVDYRPWVVRLGAIMALSL